MVNFYFELASAGFLVCMLVCMLIKFTDRSAQKVRFIRLTVTLLIANLLDYATTVGMKYITKQNLPVFYIGYALDFISIALTVYFYALYIEGYVHNGEHFVGKMRIINNAVLGLYMLAHFINPFAHFFYYFDDNLNYVHGDWYIVIYAFPMYIMIYGISILLINRKLLSPRQISSMLTFSAIVIIAATMQVLVCPDYLICLFAGSLGVVIMFFALETPDYQVLYDTMDELKKAEETAQLERLKAYAANQAKSSFLANVSHEIRTPINAVLGMNEMILRESKDPKISEYAMDVNAAGRSLLSIINDILDISKIEAGKVEIIPAEYELGDMIKGLVDMTAGRAREKGLEFIVNVDENLPTRLYGDDLRLKQIIVNLLSNGVKYTPEGSVTFNLSGDVNGDTIVLHVEVLDTGVGIKEEELKGLFEAFQRLDERTNRSIEGTGLGMSIANELLSLMGSRIFVESVYGEGSKFFFDVEQKIVDATPIGSIETSLMAQAKTYSHTISFKAPKAKILVVDDNSINRKVVSGLLKGIGCEITEAVGGYDCLDKVKEKAYDLILLDHLMPDLDGVWTLEKIRSEENLCQNVPVIAFTANAVSGMRESFLQTGFSGFISKPVAADKLEEVLLEFLPKDLIEEGEVVFDEATKNEELPDLDDFDFRYALVCLNSNSLIKSVAADFYSQSEKIYAKLCELIETIDDPQSMSLYRTEVHGLKSTSRMLGEITLSGLAKTSEDAAKIKDVENLRLLHPFILKEIERAREELKELLPEDTDNCEKVKITDEELRQKLEELKVILDDRDIDKADSFALELEKLDVDDKYKSTLDTVIEQIKMIKLIKAMAAVDELLALLEG